MEDTRTAHCSGCDGESDQGQCDAPFGVAYLALTVGDGYSCGIRSDDLRRECWGANVQVECTDFNSNATADGAQSVSFGQSSSNPLACVDCSSFNKAAVAGVSIVLVVLLCCCSPF